MGAEGVAMRVGGARAPMPEVKREALAYWLVAFLPLLAKPFDAVELAMLQPRLCCTAVQGAVRL